MYSVEQLNDLYERIARTVDISKELFDIAEKEYLAMGAWLDAETPEYYVKVYAQGSFALGTVVKPLTEKDEYDIDLVCEFAEQYNLSAKELKIDVVKPLLAKYKRMANDLINKRRCWRVDYRDLQNFHMDVIPAVLNERCIKITDHDEEEDAYEYICSNPKGYLSWFNDRKRIRYEILRKQYIAQQESMSKGMFRAEVQGIPEYHLKTPMQKAIQLLKRHRDIQFENRKSVAPISIIITTLAAEIYDSEETIYDSLNAFFGRVPKYIQDHKVDGKYHIDNPSYTGEEKENFAEKWNTHSDRATAFFEWFEKARKDFVDGILLDLNRLQMAEHLKSAVGGALVEKVFSQLAIEDRRAIEEKVAKVVPMTGALSASGSIPVPTNHHHGK